MTMKPWMWMRRIRTLAKSVGPGTGLAEVNVAVNQMDQVTQQNAAMVEEATAAANGLAGETGELARMIGEFRTGVAETERRIARAA